jgi:hypothetical protein
MSRIFDRLGWALAGALALGFVAVVAGAVRAGPLDPPGPPTSSPAVRLPGTPITQPGSFPIVINQPGSYYLAENITGVSGQNGIQISSSNVTLDLQGQTLRGVPGSTSGIVVSGLLENVVIRNGVVTAWGGYGIDANTASHGEIADVISSKNALAGIRFGLEYSVLRDCQAFGNGDTGATVSGNWNLITRCAFDNNDTQGLKVSGTTNRVLDNVADGNGSFHTGFWITGTNNAIEHNSAMANTNYGFWFDASGTTANANYANTNTGGLFNAQYNITNNCIDCDIGTITNAGNAPTYWGNVDR